MVLRIGAHLDGDGSPVEQLGLVNLGQAGGGYGFVVKRFKKLFWGFVEVFSEESIHLLGETRRNLKTFSLAEPCVFCFVSWLSPLCTSCSRPCLPVFAACGCTRAAAGGWRNTDLGRVWCIFRRCSALPPPCTLPPSGGRLTSRPSRMGCSSRGGRQWHMIVHTILKQVNV